MPYIKADAREQLDHAIADLASRLVSVASASDDPFAFAGLLNYACTSLAARVLRGRFGPIRYGHIATVTGVFKNVADEFYRRVATPYEDMQIEKNGDVEGYRDLLVEMKNAPTRPA